MYDGPNDVLLITLANAIREDPFEDINDNGLYDTGEPFQDLNGDGAWTDTNGNGVFDETFRTFSFPMDLAGEPDAHSLNILAPFTTPEGIRQLRLYTVYRTEIDLDGDGLFINADNDGDGVMDFIEDSLAGTGLPWDTPYIINEVNATTIVLLDDSGNSITIDRTTGTINDGLPHTPPRVMCNNLHSFDVGLQINAVRGILANIQMSLLRNIESFNVNATRRGRVYAMLATGVYVSN